eukprot:15442002-Alexandrium_andersonii.AAC.1
MTGPMLDLSPVRALEETGVLGQPYKLAGNILPVTTATFLSKGAPDAARACASTTPFRRRSVRVGPRTPLPRVRWAPRSRACTA